MQNVRYLFNLLNHDIKSLADAKYQKDVWIDQEGNNIDSYDESTMYFMNKCEEIFSEPFQFEGVNEEILASLKKLYMEIKRFDDEVMSEKPENKDYEILGDQRWNAIQKLASETYFFILNNLKERNYEPEDSKV